MHKSKVKVYKIKEILVVENDAMLFYISHVFVPLSLGRWAEYVLLNSQKGFFKLESEPIDKSIERHAKRSEGPAQPYVTQSCIESMKSSGHDEDAARLQAIVNLVETNKSKGVERPKRTEVKPARERRVRVSGQPALPNRSIARPKPKAIPAKRVVPKALPAKSTAAAVPVDWLTRKERETVAAQPLDAYSKQRGR